MSRKNVLTSYQIVTAGDMSTSSITSATTNVQYLDNVAVQCNFTGSPVGVFDLQVSIDNVNFAPLGLNIAASNGSPIVINANQLSAPYVRLTYTKTSGTGTLNAFISGKEI